MQWVKNFAVCFLVTSNVISSDSLTDSEILAFAAPSLIKEKFPYYLSGYDKEGVPIWIYEAGKWDFRRFVEKGGEIFDAMDIYLDQMYLIIGGSALNSTAKQFLLICDMNGFSIQQAGHMKTMHYILSKFTKLEEFNRNGILKRGWFVNANSMWERVWKLGSPFLGELSTSMEMFGTNKEFWVPKLLKELPKDQLPEWYGGSPYFKPVMILG